MRKGIEIDVTATDLARLAAIVADRQPRLCAVRGCTARIGGRTYSSEAKEQRAKACPGSYTTVRGAPRSGMLRMNDAADAPSKPTSVERGFRKLSDEELEHILADHKKWVEAKDTTGLDGLRADLSRADLRGAQLQGTNLDSAQLQRPTSVKPTCSGQTLRGSTAEGPALFRRTAGGPPSSGPSWRGPSSSGAHLCGADLADANFEGREIEEEEELGLRDISPANLTDADFRDADLSNAQLSTVTGLRAELLAGAVITNAKLPEDVARFDQLKHVEETSRNATTVFFALLAASLYSWLTIATTTDVALITGTASSPIINTNIALSGFYLAAPLILLAVYFYFHMDLYSSCGAIWLV